MDVTGGLLRLAAERPHPFVVAVPGATESRLRVERECRRRGWPAAASPAEADLLVVCGGPGPSLTDLVDRVWEQMPGPRARVTADREQDVVPALGEGQRVLADAGWQRAAAAGRVSSRGSGSDTGAGGSDARMGGNEQSGEDTDGGQGDERVGDAGQGEHGGHHGGMSMPGGLGMAGRADDRDGLALDVLHVPLGPLLPDWPCGLVIDTVLQGDVVQQADPRLVDAGSAPPAFPFWDEPWLRAMGGETVPGGYARRRLAAAHLDGLGRFLGVAGWPGAARAARRLRDDALAGVEGRKLVARFDRFARRLRRSRLLRWMTDGLGRLDAGAADRHGIGGPALRAGGDVMSRWTRWVDECADALAGADDERPLPGVCAREGPRGRMDGGVWPSRVLVEALPPLLEGVELAQARLVVASLDPDPDELAGERAAAEVPRD